MFINKLVQNKSTIQKVFSLVQVAGIINIIRISLNYNKNNVFIHSLRGNQIKFYANTKRLLWQSFGQEKIEPDLLDFIDSIPHSEVYYDVGASTGLFAIYAAATGKKVFTFEPESTNYYILQKNNFLNRDIIKHKMYNINFALSDESGFHVISQEKYGEGQHLKTLNKLNSNDILKNFEHEQICITETLDNFLRIYNAPIPNFIKIDVDGTEFKVLQGMSKLLSNDSLKKIFIEIEGSDNLKKIKEFLRNFSFELVDYRQVQRYTSLNNCVFVKQFLVDTSVQTE
jgi:FkbM family methyltransferase